MPELRVVLVMVPPLLADLIRHALAARFPAAGAIQLSVSTATGDPRDIGWSISPRMHHVAILGPGAGDLHRTAWPSGVTVLTLSPDLSQILGPDPADREPLTPDGLARRLRDISETI